MISINTVEKIIDAGLASGADYVEVYSELEYSSKISLLSSAIDSVNGGVDAGTGIRLIFADQVLYGYSNSSSCLDLLELLDNLLIEKKSPALAAVPLALSKADIIHPAQLDLRSHHNIEEKIELLTNLDSYSRQATGEQVSQVSSSIMQTQKSILIYSSSGLAVEEQRNYIRLNLSIIAQDGTLQAQGTVSPGALMGQEFLRKLDLQELAEDAGRQARVKLYAKPCPAGKLPVIIARGFGGVIFHEACGHALETTAVAKKASVFTDKLNQQIATDLVSAVDDGTSLNDWGSSSFDDEGLATQRTQLIKNGILKSYLVDMLGSIQTGYPRTGSGRRQSYKFAPASRMRNTYIEAGDSSLEEMLSSIDYGLYAAKMGGGSVSPGTGEFNFAVNEAYIIRQGRLAEPVKSASLIGYGADILQKITMVGQDLEQAQGICGSVSGQIPTNVGQPCIKVDEILVGGEA